MVDGVGGGKHSTVASGPNSMTDLPPCLLCRPVSLRLLPITFHMDVISHSLRSHLLRSKSLQGDPAASCASICPQRGPHFLETSQCWWRRGVLGGVWLSSLSKQMRMADGRAEAQVYLTHPQVRQSCRRVCVPVSAARVAPD